MLWTTKSNLNFPVSVSSFVKWNGLDVFSSVPPNLLSTLSTLISTPGDCLLSSAGCGMLCFLLRLTAHSPHCSWEEEEWDESILFLGSLAVSLPWVNCLLSQMPWLLSSFWDHLFTSYSLFQLPVAPPSPCPCRPKGGDNSVAPILRSLLAPS